MLSLKIKANPSPKGKTLRADQQRQIQAGTTAPVIVCYIFNSFQWGEMTEWPKVRHWKCRVPYPGTAGSNPALSAIRRGASNASNALSKRTK